MDYKNLDNIDNKIDIITKFFIIYQSTFYRWLNEHESNLDNIINNIYLKNLRKMRIIK